MGQKKVLFAEPLCELGGSRTHNRLIRSQGLYPIELLVQSFLTLQKYSFFPFRKQKNEKNFVVLCKWLKNKEIFLFSSLFFLPFFEFAFVFFLSLPHQHINICHHEIIID